MKGEVLNMMHGQAEGKPHLQSITTLLTDQILPTLTNEQASDEATYNTQFGLFATYAQDHSAATAALDTTAVTHGKSTHQTCRDRESVLHGEKNVCLGEEASRLGLYTTARNDFNAAGNTLNMHGDEHCVAVGTDKWLENSEANFNIYGQRFDTAREKLESYWEKQSECVGRSGNWTDKTTECDGNQESYENAACGHAVAFKGEQNSYTTQYD